MKKNNGIFDSECRLYPESKVENLQSQDKLRVGRGTHVRGELFVYPYGEGIRIGNNCYVGEGSVLRSGNKLIIGNNVLIAHNVTIIDTDSHEIDPDKRASSFRKLVTQGHPKSAGCVKTAPIIINDNVWISYNVGILKGTKIGKNTIIGAGTIVHGDIPENSLVIGNPQRIIPITKEYSGGG